MDPHAAEAQVEEMRRRFFTDLLAAAHDQQSSTAASGTFATSGLIDVGTVPDSLTVQGVGALRLPLSAANVAKLRNVCEQAPHGHGANTVRCTAIRRAWQVDAAKVSFPTKPEFLTKTLQEVAGTAVRAMGVDCPVASDNPEVEARLYKLLLYETGGHFKPLCDTEKEVGMFATLIVQLPTERGFKGGALMVEHGPGAMTFDYSKQSATGFFYTSFLADCQHTLQPVTAGARLCLSLNLVRRTTRQIGPHQILQDCPRVRKVEDVLQPWLEATEALEEASNQSSTSLPTKFAIPLQHKYTATNLGFAGLKGEDMVLAQVLRSCFDRRLALHLCLVTKSEYGSPNAVEPPPCQLFRRAWAAGEQDPRFTMEHVLDETVETFSWVSIGDHKMPVYPKLALDTEVVLGNDQPGLFANKRDPDEFQYMGYFGNAGPTLDFFNPKAMLVVWPKSKIVETLAPHAHSHSDSFHENGVLHHKKAGLLSLLNMVEAMHKEKDPHVCLVLNQVLAYCERDRVRIWQLSADMRRCLDKNKSLASIASGADDVSSRLLDVCMAVGGRANVLRVLKFYGDRFTVQSRCGPPQTEMMIIGMRSGFVTKSIAAAVQTYGWAACGGLVLQLLQKNCLVEMMQFKPRKAPEPLIEGVYCLQLVVELQRVQCWGAALIVAEKTFKLIYATVTRSGKSPASIINAVVNMLVASSRNCFAGLAECLLLHAQAGVYNQQHLLKKVLQSNDLWNVWTARPHGRDALRALVEGRLAWIDARSEKPVPSWCQPFAQFPDHPSIQAFLRGPEPNLMYYNLCSLPEARNLASWFDGCYRDGYCAIGTEGGRGAGAFCVIEKCPDAFTHVVRKWEKERKEAEGLRRKIQCTQEWRDRPMQRAPKRVRAEAHTNVP